MPATTPNLGIPYPLDADAQSAFPAVAAQGAGIIDSALATFVQGDVRVSSVTSAGDFTVTFPTAFAAIPTVVVSDGAQGSGAYYFRVIAIRVGGFDARAIRADGTALTSGNVRCNWIAFGKRVAA
jgi:hypothetical protein